MRISGKKAFKSTAQKLADYREELRGHYESLRNPKKKPVNKPSSQLFTGFALSMAKQIEDEELKKHEKVLATNNTK